MKDEWEAIRASIKRQIDQLTREAFLGTASTSTDKEPELAKEGDLEEMARLLSQAPAIPEEDLIHMIVITIWAPHHAALKCRYEGKWYVLINKLDWPEIKRSIPFAPPDSPLSTGLPGLITGIPIVEDDELARKILVAALANSPRLSDPGCWRTE
jgi:hypothetical protein